MNGKKAFKVSSAAAFLASVTMISSLLAVCAPVSASADTVDNSDKYRVTVTWVVNNDMKDSRNNLEIKYWKSPSNVSNLNDCYSQTGSVMIQKAAQSNGTHTSTFTLPGTPSEIRYSGYGKSVDKSKWYLTKVEVEPINAVAGSGQKLTYWEGRLGLELKNIGGASNANSVYFNGSAPTFGSWGKSGASKEKSTSSYFNGGFKPAMAGATEIPGDGIINIPTDGNTATYTINPGVLYDQYGVKWPCQKLEDTAQITFNYEDITVSGNNTIVVQPSSNDANDYQLTFTQKFYGVPFTCQKVLTFKTFDYNVTFKDRFGFFIKTETLDWGGTATLPPTPADYSDYNYNYYFRDWEGGNYRVIEDGKQDIILTPGYNKYPRNR